MKLFKKRPKSREGYSIVMHLDPHATEPQVWPATYTSEGIEIKPERIKYMHRILGYSYKKIDPDEIWKSESTENLLKQLNKELKNGQKKKSANE